MWAIGGDRESAHLASLLTYASSHFARHIDWFLRHRDIGISTLATILAIESAVAGSYVSDKIKPGVALIVLVMLTLLFVPLTLLAVGACRRSFSAALEHAALTAKVMWAMGLTQGVPVRQEIANGEMPFKDDKFLYVPRYLSDISAFSTTESYVDFHLAKRGTTFYATKWTLRMVGLLAIVLGAVTVIAIASKLWFR